MKGGGFFNSFFNYDKPIYNKVTDSEYKYLKSYIEYIKARDIYFKNKEEHMANLITFSNMANIGNGFKRIFEEIVYPNDIEEKYDIYTDNPLLLGNYNINNESLPIDIRREHVRQQFLYYIKKLNPNDEKLITDVEVSLNNNKIKVNIIMNDVINYEFDNITIDSDYIVNKNEIERVIKSAIKQIKSFKPYLTSSKPLTPQKSSFELKTDTTEETQKNHIKNTINNKSQFKKLIQNPIEPSNNGPQSLKDKLEEKRAKARANYNELKHDIHGSDEEYPFGNNKPLTAQQISHSLHQQTPQMETNEDGKVTYGNPSIIETALADLLGIPIKEDKKADTSLKLYEEMPLDALKKIKHEDLTKEELDVVCKRFSDDEETCSKIKQCWYNAKTEPKCYRFKDKDET